MAEPQADPSPGAGPASGGAPLLEVAGIHVFYGSIEAVKGVSLEVRAGQIVTLIGANGAGKTTTLRTISGLLRPREGTIRFEGARIDELAPHRIVGLRVGHVPEGRRVFARLTVRDNLALGAFTRRDTSELDADLDRVFALFPVLQQRERQAAGTLSGGEQQMLAIGRALMSRPRLLMLDEPSMGLAPLVVERIFETIAEISRSGVTVLLVEQNAHLALALADHGYVLESGRIVLSDTGDALLGNAQVRKAYLGED
ncbi:MAG: ABC transporter ATP-binding protein [Actinomycetota bacterium]